MRKTIARWLLVSALACFGSLTLGGLATAQDGTTVQGTQSSTDASATTGTSEGENTSDFTGGPAADGTAGASAQQLGTNSGSVSQSGSAKSGDPVAGAQVTGAVADNVTVQNQNAADNPNAVAGNAEFTNDLDAFLGPSAFAEGGAQSHQIGSNLLEVVQSSEAATGDAVAGSQVTGIVGEGEHTVQNQNVATCDDAPCAQSFNGDSVLSADADNFVETAVGPVAESFDPAQSGQVGSNDAIISQSAEAHSGDALFGSQVTGSVGGSVTVQNQNSSENNGEGPSSQTGGADAENDIFSPLVAMAGPQALSESTAEASQIGANSIDASQDVAATSGDALSGAQVTGAVGDAGGFMTVQNQQASEDDDAVSGDVEVNNSFDGDAGAEADAFGEGAGTAEASQIGDNAVTVAQAVAAGTGDAVGGGQVTGGVGFTDITVQNQNSADGSEASSGEVNIDGDVNSIDADAGADAEGFLTASASQLGDNAISGTQDAVLHTGDAVAGAQVTGLVATDDANVTVQNQNTAVDVEANDGDGDGEIDIEGDVNDFDVDAGPYAFSEEGGSQSSQNGSNALAADQSAELATGDAVAAAQVTGVIAGDNSDVTIQNQNDGETSSANDGEDAASIDVGGDINDIEAFGGPEAESVFGTAEASHIGDNSAAFSQDASLATGDGVSGAQVTGVVAGDGSDVTVQNQNSADDTDVNDDEDAAEIDVDGDVMTIDSDLGPIAEVFVDPESALATQNGDNALVTSQDLSMATGDAVGGAQVTGIVAGDDSTLEVQNQNTATGVDINDDDAASIDLDNEAVDLDANLGPIADTSGTAEASQLGNDTLDAVQNIEASTGDAVGGSQVTGTVAGDGSDTTIQNQNSADDVQVNDAENAAAIVIDDEVLEVDAALGAQAFADGPALASQNGDTAATISQNADLSTGDAVSGAQVTGAIAGDDSTITAQLQNEADDTDVNDADEAASIDIDDNVNSVDIEQGGTADSLTTAEASQIGSNSTDVAQVGALSTGDAVGGAQVTGTVAGDNSETTVQAQNTAEGIDINDDGAASIDVDQDVNDADIDSGPFAIADETALATQNGDNAATLGQDLTLATGDAVGGAQVTGSIAGSDSEITVQNQNDADDIRVNDGEDAAHIDLGGDGNDAEIDLGAAAVAFNEGSTAEASQLGDNAAEASQSFDAATGDAVGGSQVTGAVAGDGSDVTVQNQNTSVDVEAFSGDIDVTGEANDLEANLGPNAEAFTALAEQVGDNWLAFGQDASGSTGDAVAGSQVTGVVGPEDSTLQFSNSDEASIADSGDVELFNVADGSLSPVADGFSASANQIGDSGFDGSQGLDVESGDAVAGTQVSGIVGSSAAFGDLGPGVGTAG